MPPGLDGPDIFDHVARESVRPGSGRCFAVVGRRATDQLIGAVPDGGSGRKWESLFVELGSRSVFSTLDVPGEKILVTISPCCRLCGLALVSALQSCHPASSAAPNRAVGDVTAVNTVSPSRIRACVHTAEIIQSNIGRDMKVPWRCQHAAGPC